MDLRACARCANSAVVGDWAVHAACRRKSGDHAAARVHVRRSDLEEAGAMGGAAYLQPGGHCAAREDLCALSRRGQYRRDGDWRAHFAAGAGRKQRRHSLQTHERAGLLSRGRRPESARVARRSGRPAHCGVARRDLCADLYAVESRDVFSRHCHFARPDALDKGWAGVFKRVWRQVRESEIQVSRDCDGAGERPPDCRKD